MVSNPSRLLVQRGINETFITFNDRELLDISRALNLIDRALLLWLGALLAVTLILQ